MVTINSLMKLAYVDIENFRGISKTQILFNDHSVLIGDNNAGKSTIFEAIDLVLGPDRLNKFPVIDEHDFYNGIYYIENENSPLIIIEVLVIDLSDDQIRRFRNNIEYWDTTLEIVLGQRDIDSVDDDDVVPALRVKFIGQYDPEDDDFKGETYFCSPPRETGELQRFQKADKRECGFLYLRALRTGARALSMERGSLLDIILKIREIRPKMWENILGQLRGTDVGTDPEAGIKDILVGVQAALKEFVPIDWGTAPHLRVSDLTREHVRKTLTIFMSTGDGTYAAPFHHQGTGTVNTMVLALLTMIADAKANVIFAMEEPEIAIPPYTQKRIINSIRSKSTQAIFTSHSPFVLEEFAPEQIILIQRDSKGKMNGRAVRFPSIIKPKNYSSQFRLRFSESLLAKRIFLTEGSTEATAYPAAARRLEELNPDSYSSFEAMGVAVFDVESETNVPTYGKYFTDLGKVVFATFDKQSDEHLEKIKASVPHYYEAQYKGIEDLLLKELPISVLKTFYQSLQDEGRWPTHITAPDSTNDDELREALFRYLKKNKGEDTTAELMSLCLKESDVPETIRKILSSVKEILTPKVEKSEA